MCNGQGIPCDGVHEKRTTVGLLSGGTFHIIFYCSECNGLGYRPKDGWKGRDKSDSSIPASGPKTTEKEREQIQKIGDKYGCHTCGATQPKSKGRWIADHVPPTAVCEAAEEVGAIRPRQQLRPQCPECSAEQAKRVKEHKNTFQQ